MNSKLAAPIGILVLLVVVIFALVIHWHETPDIAQGEPVQPTPVTGTITPETTNPATLAAWTRPTTTDPARYAIAFGSAIWTYDATAHSYVQWQDAVTAFASPLESPDAGRVARSMLPYVTQWDELKIQKAHASVRDLTAATTPELQALARDPRAPAGWYGFVVRGTQEAVVDGVATKAERHVTVGVVCRPRCSFWSASNELPQ